MNIPINHSLDTLSNHNTIQSINNQQLELIMINGFQGLNLSNVIPTNYPTHNKLSSLFTCQANDKISVANESTNNQAAPSIFNPYPDIGLAELIRHCTKVCRSDPTIIQTGRQYVFDGGQEPLDLIHVYLCDKTPTYWHYVSFGLSDIHNYQETLKLHQILGNTDPNYQFDLQKHFPEGADDSSGFGFELTFRLKCDPPKPILGQLPPSWPIELMQSIARFVYKSNFPLNEGDYIIWKEVLQDGSLIKHFLLTVDHELKQVYVGLNANKKQKVEFIQLVGVTQSELDNAVKGDSRGIMETMRKKQSFGHELLITDMQRKDSLFDSVNRNQVPQDADVMGSKLISLAAKHCFSRTKPKWLDIESVHDNEDEEIPEELKQIYLSIGLDAANQLPTIINYRLTQGKIFILTSLDGKTVTYLLPDNVATDDVEIDPNLSKQNPYSIVHEYDGRKILHVLIDAELREAISNVLIPEDLSKFGQSDLPKIYSLPEKSFHLVICSENQLNLNN